MLTHAQLREGEGEKDVDAVHDDQEVLPLPAIEQKAH